VGPRAGLEGCDPRTVQPVAIAISTELSRPTLKHEDPFLNSRNLLEPPHIKSWTYRFRYLKTFMYSFLDLHTACV
jgi:hypothetical protein